MTYAPAKTLILLDGTVDQRTVQAALPPNATAQTVDVARSIAYVQETLDTAPPELVLAACSSSTVALLDVLETLRRHWTESTIVILQHGSPNGFMQRAFAAGADDLIALPQSTESIAFAIEKALARRRGGSATGTLGRMICVLGPKGGTGKTLTVCNLAVALALAGRRSVVVDVDLQFGDVGIALGLQPTQTIYDLAVSGGSIDETKTERFLAQHPSGASVLLAPTRPDQAGAIDIGILRDVYASLRRSHEYVIVDTPPAFSPEVIAAIDSATDLCVVGMLDALSLKDTKLGLETLALMGHDLAQVKLVLNRADTNIGISHADVAKILGRRPDVFVPSDRAIPRAITDGTPIVVADPRSGAARAFTSLAQLFLADEVTPAAGGTTPAEARPAGRRLLLRRGR